MALVWFLTRICLFGAGHISKDEKLNKKFRISKHDKLEHQIGWNLWLFYAFALLCFPALPCGHGTSTCIQCNLLSGGRCWTSLLQSDELHCDELRPNWSYFLLLINICTINTLVSSSTRTAFFCCGGAFGFLYVSAWLNKLFALWNISYSGLYQTNIHVFDVVRCVLLCVCTFEWGTNLLGYHLYNSFASCWDLLTSYFYYFEQWHSVFWKSITDITPPLWFNAAWKKTREV